MKKFLKIFFDGSRFLIGILAALLIVVTTLKKEELEVILFFVIIMLVCFYKNKIFIKLFNNSKNLNLRKDLFKETIKVEKEDQINRQELDKYEGTGEIFKFKYLKNENTFIEKEVTLEYLYTFNKILYIKAYDLNLRTYENFELNKISL